MDESWLVRQHRNEGKKLFHPAHGFLPLPATALGVQRAAGVGPLHEGWKALTFSKVTVEPTKKESRSYRPTSGYSGIRGSTIEEYDEGEVSDCSYEVTED